MRRFVLVLALTGFIMGSAFAATISGKVQCQMERKAISDALIILLKPGNEQFSQTVVSDAKGNFFFADVKPGKYNIEVVREGYYKNVLFDLKVENDQDYTVNVKLLKKAHKGDSDYCFMMGGIEVCSEEKEIIPEEMVTTRKISSGEIEHLQATNLGDVLSLVPGIAKTSNPGLSHSTTVGIRAVGSGNNSPAGIESFGTGIILDGNDLSRDGDVGGVAGGAGLDLRALPADNIKSVEVISGIPSVEYGNISNGTIKVETRSGVIAPKLKLKFNPDTKEANFLHGFRFARGTFDYSLNFAQSERDPRLEKDAVNRYHIKTDLIQRFLHDKLETRLAGSATYLYADQKPEDEKKITRFNHDYYLNNSFTVNYDPNERVQYKAIFALNVSQEKDHTEKWNSDPVFIPYDSTVTIGTGDEQYTTDSTFYDTLFGYLGKKNVIGKQWKISSKITRKQQFIALNFKNNLLTGFEYRQDFNSGQGVVLDSVLNYYGPQSSRRSFSYSEYPVLHTLSFYIQDEISKITFNHKWDMMLGLRYDNFNPRGINRGKHGVFLNPRFNFRYFITDDLRLRFGIGRTAKAISLSFLYQDPDYWKHVVNGYTIEEKQERTNPDLTTYTTIKTEMSLDWRFKNGFGTSITGYYSESNNQPRAVSYPWAHNVNPDTITSKGYSIYENVGWRKHSGMELTLKTRRFKNLQFQSSVVYKFSKDGTDALKYDDSPDTSNGELIWYQSGWDWREKVILNLQLNYISQRLGVWTTLDIQYIPLDHKKTIYLDEGYQKYDGSYYKDFVEWHQGMSYFYSRYLYDYSGYWMFNFRITKTLSTRTEMSFYVNNVFDDRAIWYDFLGSQEELNPEIYFGLEVSVQW